jgi:hypothetical protein
MTADGGVCLAGEEFSPELEIKTIRVGRPHVVILGAGASRAACPDGDARGTPLPVMADLVEVFGLSPILSKYGFIFQGQNFEELYSRLLMAPEKDVCREEIETHIRNTLSSLCIPETPTVYDHLVLSLRPRDVIATFNWDPLLVQAVRRNSRVADPPRLLFLHGNVAVGFCGADKCMGYIDKTCSHCGKPFTSTPLLYPVTEKQYGTRPFIKAQWEDLNEALEKACRLTIFGYGAPASDVEAIALMIKAWGLAEERDLEQIEIIDLKAEDELLKTWGRFIHTHHYATTSTFYKSSIARHPRRTGEAWAATHVFGMWERGNPLPDNAGFPELWEWYESLLEQERRAAAGL